MNTYYPQDPIVGSIVMQNNELQAYDGNDWITIDKLNGTIDSINGEEGLYINDLKNRIEKLEEGFRKIERKNEREKRRRIYNLMGRIEELNRDDSSRRFY